MVNLAGKVALVTGGSVGKELAKGFLRAGANVAFIYRNSARKSELDKEFADHSDAYESVQADLGDASQAKRAVMSVRDRFGGIDFLLNSLGGWVGGKKLHEHSGADLDKMLSIDLVPTFNIMSAVIPVMVKEKFGRIVNFVSMQVFGTGAGNSVYAASKSAVLALSKAAAEEYKDAGISVFTIAPSTIDTENNRKWMAGSDRANWVGMDEIVDAAIFVCGAGHSINDTVLKFPGRV
jgi:3-oxoacyl-[acyl-carrier protein] reductase